MFSLFSKSANIRKQIVEELRNDSSIRVRYALAMNTHLPEAFRQSLLEEDEQVADYDPYDFIENPPEEMSCAVWPPRKPDVSSSPNTPLPVLLRLANDEDNYTAGLAVQNPAMPVDKLEEFARNPKFFIYIVRNPNCPVWLLEKFSRRSEVSLRGAIAENPFTPAHILKKLAESYEGWVQNSVAANPATPLDLLKRLAEHPEPDIRENVAKNSALPVTLINKLSNDSEYKVRLQVARNPVTPLPVLLALMEEKDEIIWRDVASHPAVPPDLLTAWADKHNEYLLRGIADNPRTPPSVLLKLARNHARYSDHMQVSLANNLSSTNEILGILMSYGAEYTANMMANHPQASAELLAKLVEFDEDDWSISQSLAQNPTTPAATLDMLADADDETVRHHLASRNDISLKSLKKLASDDSETVRESVARHIRLAD